MKNLIRFATISTVVLLAPTLVNAQGYPSGAPIQTIYVPPIETTTITPTQITPIIIQPNYNSFGTSTTTTYHGGGRPIRQRRQQYQHQQSTVIYPPAVQSSCSTSIIGSPIPSPIALDRSGQPCH
jgi:hypothetical protein